MPAELDTLLEGLDAQAMASDSIEGQRLHRVVRARLLDETVPETRIDRFVVSERLGVGGMGVVYAAYDAQLDRTIAIKLVRSWTSAERVLDQRRLIREARALAKLSHPHVVAIYDVGLHRDRVFIAMELVRGTTLRKHVQSGVTPWPEIVRCYLQAGEGLAAAHAVGLVHRDFKPDNALVAPEGTSGEFRVRVLDFGLAAADGSTIPSSSSSAWVITATSLTATGKVVGTPAYMAPEQFAGAPADARTDQFSFCVAFWEALHGERPFPATQTPELRRQMLQGKIAKVEHPERAPQWLRDVLVRGLAANPDLRWPSMRALLDACKRRPIRWRRWAIGAGIAISSAVVAVGGWALVQSQRRNACERDATELAAIWNDDTAAIVDAAFVGSGISHAPATALRIDALLTEYTGAWAQARARACVAHLSGVLDDDAMRLREACLDDQRERLAALIELLQQPDHDLVNSAMRSAYELPRQRLCEDDARLAATAATLGANVEPARVAALRRKLARADQLGTARPTEALALANEAHDEAVALADLGLQAEADLEIGWAQVGLGEYDDAEAVFERAYFAAGPLGADEIALFAATQLVDVVGVRLGRFDDGLAWGRHAEGLLARIGDSRRWRAAALAESIGNVLREKGDVTGARASYQHAIELRTEDAGPDHPMVGQAYANLGSLLAERRMPDAAAPALAEAERILVAAYGPDALLLAKVYSTRCAIELEQNRLNEAAASCERALQILERALGRDHPSVAVALGNLGATRGQLGDQEGARALFARAVEIRRARLGPMHPSLANSLSNLGLIETHAEDFAAAESHLREALQIRRATLPSDHPDFGQTLLNLADVYLAQKQPARALPLCEEAEQISALGVDDLARVHGRALTTCGLARLTLGDAGAARDELERAMATPYARDSDPVARCELRHALARALLATGGGGPRVRELARDAHAECVAAGPRAAELLPDLAKWMQ